MNKLVKLSEIANISLGQTFREKAEASESIDNIKLIQIKDIKPGLITNLKELPFANLTKDKLKIKIQKNDILIPIRGNRFSAALFCPNDPDALVTTVNHVAIIKPNTDELEVRYLLWYLNSRQGSNSISQLSSGAVQSFITQKALSELKINLPDISAQIDIGDVYFNWIEQSKILNNMLENGSKLTEKYCYKLSRGK